MHFWIHFERVEKGEMAAQTRSAGKSEKSSRLESWKQLKPNLENGQKPKTEAKSLEEKITAKGNQHRIWRSRTMNLAEGILTIYKKSKRNRKIQEERMDLGRATVSYKRRKKRILVESEGRNYEMKLKSRNFPTWLDAITKHQLERQHKLRSSSSEEALKKLSHHETETDRKLKPIESQISHLKRLLQDLKNLTQRGATKGSITSSSRSDANSTTTAEQQKMDCIMLGAEAVLQSLQKECERLEVREEQNIQNKDSFEISSFKTSLAENSKPPKSTDSTTPLVQIRSQQSLLVSSVAPKKQRTKRLSSVEREKEERNTTAKTEVASNDGSNQSLHFSGKRTAKFIPSTSADETKYKLPWDMEGSADDVSEGSITSENGEETYPEAASPKQSESKLELKPMVRRTVLPAPMPEAETISIWKLARNKFQTPIRSYEPLSMLQFVCEELDRADLLDKAASSTEETERICWVAGFAVSPYASTYYRGGRKPFNPLLGETFDCDRWAERGWRAHAEQVSHHPPVSALHGEGRLGWTYLQVAGGKFKFAPNQFELIPDSTIELKLHRNQETYSWNKVNTLVHNIQCPRKRCVSHYGEMIIRSSSGLQCRIQFQKGETKHGLTGKVLKNGKLLFPIAGNWTSGLWSEKKRYFEIKRMPQDHQVYYGFSSFARELNELTDEVKKEIPPTDSRLRPDQRFLEEGNVKAAEAKKVILEQKQRERAAEMEKRKESYQPLWFNRSTSGKKDHWISNGNYWKSKSQKFAGNEFPNLW